MVYWYGPLIVYSLHYLKKIAHGVDSDMLLLGALDVCTAP
jgi:hypothetical protein